MAAADQELEPSSWHVTYGREPSAEKPLRGAIMNNGGPRTDTAHASGVLAGIVRMPSKHRERCQT
jgi:hypothetical protein